MIAVAGAMATVTTSVAEAQPEASCEGPNCPQSMFREGTALLAEGRYAAARAVLERAFALEPRASTGFNLASAMHGSGASREASQLLARVESGELGELPSGYEEARASLRDAIDARLATLVWTLEQPDEATVALDGEAIGVLESGTALESRLDPGVHELTARADGFSAFERTLSVAAGERVAMTLLLEPIVTPSDPDDGGGVEPWVWVVLGVVAAAGVATALAIVLTSDEGTDGTLLCDPELGCIDT